MQEEVKGNDDKEIMQRADDPLVAYRNQIENF